MTMKDRKTQRKQVFISAEVQFGNETQKVIVRDVSDAGAKVTTKTAPTVVVGQTGIFRKDDVKTPCQVAWVGEKCYGLAFHYVTKVKPSKPETTFVPDAPYASRTILSGPKARMPSHRHNT